MVWFELARVAIGACTCCQFNFAADRIRLVRDQLADMGNARVLTVDVFERDQMTNREVSKQIGEEQRARRPKREVVYAEL